MKYSTLVIFSAALSLLFANCENKTESFDPNIGGILMTDINGALIGSTDTDGDWEIGQDWEDEENALFDISNLDGCNLDESSVLVAAYPNPTPDIVFIAINADLEIRSTHYRIVDSNFNLVGNVDDNESESLAISLSMLGDPGIFRIYFIIEFESGCIEKGFGDIQLTN